MIYDPGLKYELSDCLRESAIARDPALLRHARARLAADLDPYPGIMVWSEEIRDGLRIISATKFPEAIARLVIARRRGAALRGEDAA